MKTDSLHILAFMSGSSLDGMDMGIIKIEYINAGYNYNIVRANTVAYTDFWSRTLKEVHGYSAEKLVELDFKYSEYCATHLNLFVEKDTDIVPDLISFHGHTIFHNPQENYTFSLGNLATISAQTNLKTVGRFRDADVALGGEGAPLMAIADSLLFNNSKVNLNLGGICNISVNGNEQIAYDLCPCNQLFNEVYKELNIDFDDKGIIGSKGNLIPELLENLLDDEYYLKGYPKSLDNNYIRDHILKYLIFDCAPRDKLYTIIEFVTTVITSEVEKLMAAELVTRTDQILCTGGGTHNDFFMNTMKSKLSALKVEIVIPNADLINYKELVLMALLGFMRVKKIHNIKGKATGALRNSIGGAIYEC